MAFTRAMLRRVLAASSLLLVALGANAALYFRDRDEARAPDGLLSAEIGGALIALPRALLREPSQAGGGKLQRLEIAVAIADFAALPPPSALKPTAPLPDRLSIILSAAGGQAGSQLGPSEQFQQLYSRFLARETWTNPGGLILRRFRQGTPYEDREIYLGAGSGRLFFALCPREEAHRAIEPCSAPLREGGIDIELRFDARYLPEWRRIVGETLTRLGEWRGAPPT